MSVDEQPSLLRIESSKEHKDLTIPDFLDIIREVTHDKMYVGSKMVDPTWRMPSTDKKNIKEGSPKKEGIKKYMSEE